MRKLLLTLSISVVALFAVSCGFGKDAFTDLRVEAGISVPLGSIVLTDSSLFALAGDFSRDLHVNPTTKVLYVLIDDSLSLINQSSFNTIFQFGTQNLRFSVSSGLPPSPVDVTFEIPNGVEQTISINLPSGERLDEMVFASGSVRLAMDNAAGKDYSQMRVTVPQIINTKTNQPLVLTVGNAIAITKDYVIKPIQNAQYSNGFTCIFSGRAPIVTDFEGTVVITLDGMQSAKGYFGRKEIIAPTITLSVSDEFEQFINMVEYLYFDDPKLVFDILNQYDAPMLAELTRLEISGESLNLKEGYNSFFVPAKGKTTFVLSNDNTVSGKQLSALIGTDFRNFVVNVNAVMNPTMGDLVGISNVPSDYVAPLYNSFSISDSLFGSYAVTIPFNAIMKNARFEQEIDIDLGSIFSEGINVSEFAFGFCGSNSMPLDIAINAFVKQGNEKLMVFDQPIVIPASLSKNEVNATPSVIEGAQMLVATVKKESLDLLLNSDKLFFELATSTKDADSGQAVQIFSPSAIELKVLVGTKLDLQLTSKGMTPQGKVIRLSN